MYCAYTRPRYQVSVYRTIGPLVLVLITTLLENFHCLHQCTRNCDLWCSNSGKTYDVLLIFAQNRDS